MRPDREVDESWRDDALCRQVDAELFFPDKTRGETGSEARRVCQMCFVREACEEYAIRTVQTYGIWGGKSERDLRKERAARGLIQPQKRVPVDRVYALADRGWSLALIAAEVGFHEDSVRRVLKARSRREAVA